MPVLFRKFGDKLSRAVRKVRGWRPLQTSRSSNESTSTLHSVVQELAEQERIDWNGAVDGLLSSGARVCEQDADGNTALHLAFLRSGEAPVVDLLMNKCSRKETRKNLANKDGLSFLHMACTRPYTRFLEGVLEDERLDVECKVKHSSSSPYAGYTPLHFAVRFGQYEVAELLLACYSANLYEQDAKGCTPLRLALECSDMKMLDLLLASDARTSSKSGDWSISWMQPVATSSPIVRSILKQSRLAEWSNGSPSIITFSSEE